MKTIKTVYWLLENKIDTDQIPDNCVVYYDVYIEGENMPIRKKLSVPLELTKELADFFQSHISEIIKVEGI